MILNPLAEEENGSSDRSKDVSPDNFDDLEDLEGEELDDEAEDERYNLASKYVERGFIRENESDPVREVRRVEEPLPRIAELRELMPLTKSGRSMKILVDWVPRTGRVRSWKDRQGEGWIQPDEPIDNDCLHKSGLVWFYDRQASESLTKKDILNLPVQFMLYEQNFSLGAAFVTPLELPGEQKPRRSQSLSPRRQRAREEWQYDERKKRRRTAKSESEEEREDFEMEDDHAFDDGDSEEFREQEGSEDGFHDLHPRADVYEKYNEDEDLEGHLSDEEGYQQDEEKDEEFEDHVPQAPVRSRQLPSPKPKSKGTPGAAQQNARTFLQQEVPAALKGLAEKEKNWSPSDLCKRILKYFTGGLTKDQPDDWKVAAEKFIKNGLDSFSRACSSKPWFLDAEALLKPILEQAAWELIQDCSNVSECSLEPLQGVVEECWARMMDGCLFDQSIRDAVHQSFAQHGREFEGKVVTALTRTHEGAVKVAAQASGSVMRKIEAFTKAWMHQSMDRASILLRKSQEHLTDDAILELFKLLLAPSISETYTCVPLQFRSPKGRPPRNWNFLRPCVGELMDRWSEEKNPKGKKEKTAEKMDNGALPQRMMPAALAAQKVKQKS